MAGPPPAFIERLGDRAAVGAVLHQRHVQRHQLSLRRGGRQLLQAQAGDALFLLHDMPLALRNVAIHHIEIGAGIMRHPAILTSISATVHGAAKAR